MQIVQIRWHPIPVLLVLTDGMESTVRSMWMNVCVHSIIIVQSTIPVEGPTLYTNCKRNGSNAGFCPKVRRISYKKVVGSVGLVETQHFFLDLK